MSAAVGRGALRGGLVGGIAGAGTGAAVASYPLVGLVAGLVLGTKTGVGAGALCVEALQHRWVGTRRRASLVAAGVAGLLAVPAGLVVGSTAAPAGGSVRLAWTAAVAIGCAVIAAVLAPALAKGAQR